MAEFDSVPAEQWEGDIHVLNGLTRDVYENMDPKTREQTDERVKNLVNGIISGDLKPKQIEDARDLLNTLPDVECVRQAKEKLKKTEEEKLGSVSPQAAENSYVSDEKSVNQISQVAQGREVDDSSLLDKLEERSNFGQGPKKGKEVATPSYFAEKQQSAQKKATQTKNKNNISSAIVAATLRNGNVA